ncbi:MAG TPA: redoxin domain-containing protein [Symbiobacteriaceae bacterium]|nr:redoxin domain-containing protein [Symbiobacteriaceae bacterium]
MLLRERYQDLQGLGVQVAAISVDHLPSLRVFDAALAQFPFALAADWHRGICRAYGVLNEETQACRRVLMLFDSTATLQAAVDPFDPAEPEQLDMLLHTAVH